MMKRIAIVVFASAALVGCYRQSEKSALEIEMERVKIAHAEAVAKCAAINRHLFGANVPPEMICP